ncbi:hypothetical protein LTR66_015559, partial [Elasticomyces elasticus]
SYFDPMVPFEDLERSERRVRSRPSRGVSYELEASEPWRRIRGVEVEGAGAELVSVGLGGVEAGGSIDESVEGGRGGDRWDEAAPGRGTSAFSESARRGVYGAATDGDADGDEDADRREVEDAGGRESEEDEEEEVTRSSGVATARPSSGILPTIVRARGDRRSVVADSPTVRVTPATPDPSRRRKDESGDEEDTDARGREGDEEVATKAKQR